MGFLQLLQLRQDVHAVDAAIGPEIEQYPLAAKFFDIQRAGRVEPLLAPLEWRGLHAVREGMLAHVLLQRSLLGLGLGFGGAFVRAVRGGLDCRGAAWGSFVGAAGLADAGRAAA